MDGNLINLLIYWSIILYYTFNYLKGRRNSNILALIFISYSISATFSIIYYSIDYFDRFNKLYLHNIIYWLIVFFISIRPLYKYDKQQILKVKYNLNILSKICILSLLLNIIPFFEYLTHLDVLFNSPDLVETISDIHNDNEKQLNLSFISTQLLKVSNYFYYIILLSIVPIITAKKKNIWAIAGITIALITKVLPGIIMSSRPLIVNSIIFIIIIIVLYYPFLNKNEQHQLKKYSFIISLFFLGSLSAITIYRQIGYMLKDNESTFLYFVSRYLGEGICNFAQYMSEIKTYTNGDQCFWLLKDILGMNPIEMTRDIGYSMQSKWGYPANEFYTYIGCFVQDIGYTGTLFFYLFTSQLIILYTKSKNKVITLSSLYIILIYAHIIIYGTMFYTYIWNGTIALKAIIGGYVFLRIAKM